jgi:hypothetical protein
MIRPTSEHAAVEYDTQLVQVMCCVVTVTRASKPEYSNVCHFTRYPMFCQTWSVASIQGPLHALSYSVKPFLSLRPAGRAEETFVGATLPGK